MRDTIIREHLDMLSNSTGIGFVFTNGGKTVTSSVYRSLDTILELKHSTRVENCEYVNPHNNTKLTYTLHRNAMNTRALYIFSIGVSAGSHYVIETDSITETIFNRHLEAICRTLLLVKALFTFFENVENLELDTLTLTKRTEGDIKPSNELAVLKKSRTVFNTFYVCKLSILNLREILNIYGTKALQTTKSELYRLLTLYEKDIKDNVIQNPIHILDDDSYYIIANNVDKVKKIVRRISDNLVDLALDNYVMPVKLGLSMVHYPTIPDINQVFNQINSGIDYLLENHSDNLSIIDMHSEQGEKVLKDYKLSEELRHTIAESKDEIIVVYQPKVDAQTGKIIGAEGLIRWNNPNRGLVPPNEFIPLSERTGIIKELGRLVLDTVIRDSKILFETTGRMIRLGANVSAIQLEDDDFVDYVESQVLNHICNPSLLDLEITESVGVFDINHTISLLSRLHKMGITLSLDDFGTGYSSLTYMKNLPLNNLKIDKSFIDSIFEETSFCKNIIDISKKLKLETVAEGVETHEQWMKLKEFGCDILQGYYFSKPIPFEDLIQRVKSDYKLG